MSRTVAISPRGSGTSDALLQELSSPSFSQPQERNPLSSTLDGMTTHFVAQAANPITLASMIAGGMAYRVGGLGMMELGSLVRATHASPLRFATIAVQLGSEVTAFELTNRTLHTISGSRTPPLQNVSHFPPPVSPLWSWSGPGGWREGLFSSLITFGTLRGLGSLGQDQNILFQHALQDTGLVAGNQVLRRLHLAPRPDDNLATQFLQAEATNLQLGAGMGLAGAFSPGIHSFERGLDLSLTFDPVPPPSNEVQSWAGGSPPLQAVATDLTASATDLRPQQDTLHPDLSLIQVYSERHDSLSPGSSSSLPSPERRRELTERYSAQFPPMGPHKIYSDEIIDRVLNTPTAISHFHERLLEALSLAPEPGTLTYRHTADAIKRTFLYNSLNTATGALESALLQHLITHLITDENSERRVSRLHETFREMEAGLSRTALSRLLEESGALDGMGSTAEPLFSADFLIRHMHDFGSCLLDYNYPEQVQIFNFAYQEFEHDPDRARGALEFFGEARLTGRYSTRDIDRALRAARQVPYGRLLLRRMLSLFIAEDVPAKLRELGEEPSSPDETFDLLREWMNRGLSTEAMVERLRGTRHTAYLEDPRLARKLLSTYSLLMSYFEQPLSQRIRWRSEFITAVQAHLRSGEELTIPRMMELIQFHPLPITRALREQWGRGAFEVRFIKNEEMDEILRQWKQVPMDVTHLFRLNEGTQPPEILIRELPPTSPQQPVDSYARRVMVTHRFHGLVHEFEHWRHFTGNYDGIERGAEAFPILKLGREGRLTTEMMAFLEENQWISLHLTEADWEIAQRMGLNLTLYYRSMADHSYYGRVNERFAREW